MLLRHKNIPPWDSPGKSTGVGCHFLLQGIFPIQGLNPGLPHCTQTLYRLSHQGSPVEMEGGQLLLGARSLSYTHCHSPQDL